MSVVCLHFATYSFKKAINLYIFEYQMEKSASKKRIK